MSSDQDKQQKQGKPQGKPAGSKPQGKDGGAKKGKHDDAPADTGPKTPPRLKVKFEQEIRSKVAEKFGIKNPMAMPKLEKIVLNVNMGRHLEGTKIPPHIKTQILDTLNKVTGQRPVVVKAKKSVANFKLRAGYESSVMVTIRRDRMWHFLDRFINLATPRIKDFRGLSDTAFDRPVLVRAARPCRGREGRTGHCRENACTSHD